MKDIIDAIRIADYRTANRLAEQRGLVEETREIITAHNRTRQATMVRGIEEMMGRRFMHSWAT